MDMCLLLLPLQYGYTPLLMASQEGLTSVAKILLEAKARTDVQSKVNL